MAKGNEISTSQSVQSLSCVQHFVTPWTAARQASLSITKPRACSNSCPLSRWCHSTISSSVLPFSSRPQSFPASGSFPVSWLFASGGHRIGASAQSFQWIFRVDFLLDWLIWSWQSKGLSRVFSSTTIWKHQFFGIQPSLWSNFHICTWLLKRIWVRI